LITDSPVARPPGLSLDAAPAELALSIVIPVYNSAPTVALLLQRVTAAATALVNEAFEVILVDDGSGPDTWAAIEAAAPAYGERVVAVQLMRNFGQHNALMCGLAHASGAVVVTMDDDLQNPPEEIGKLLQGLQDQRLDLVYGTPQQREHAGWRNLGASLVWGFYRKVFKSAVTPTSFRAMRQQLAQSVAFYRLNFTYLDGLLAWCSSRIGSVEVEHHARGQGRSGYSLGKLVSLALNLYTNFSLIPLQIVSLLGLAVACCGFALGIYYLVMWLAASISVPGFASTIIAVLVLGGVQLLALGVMGEYIGRLHLNVNRKPQYIVRQRKP
jgi:glycosyltransferase involved in cell wall biosynthesis